MRKLYILFLFIFVAASIQAQVINPASWTYATSAKEVKVGETVELIFRATLKDTWYIYSTDFDLDGPLPTEFNFKSHPSYELVGKIQPVEPKKKYSEIFEGEYTYHTGKAEFRQKVKILSENPVIEVEYNYQTCSDKEGKCIQFDEEHTFTDIKVLAAATPVKPQDKPAVKTPEPTGKNTTENQKSASSDLQQRISELENEREKYIRRDAQGRDESAQYLRNFVRKHGGNN
ncbi:MAG: protein-disulfide reductase DsbD domain-containing protein [Cytophagaceae bacterium]